MDTAPDNPQKQGIYCHIKDKMQMKIFSERKKWWKDKAKEIQKFKDSHDM